MTETRKIDYGNAAESFLRFRFLHENDREAYAELSRRRAMVSQEEYCSNCVVRGFCNVFLTDDEPCFDKISVLERHLFNLLNDGDASPLISYITKVARETLGAFEV